MSEAATILDYDDAMDLIALKSLKGDVRDFLLDEQKHGHNALPWNLRGEEAQATAIDRADRAAERLVRRVWELAMTLDRPTIVARMVQGKRKGEKIAFELQINASDELRHAAMDCVGDEVLLILAERDVLEADRGKPQPEPDQRALFDETRAGRDEQDNDNEPA